MLSLGWCEDGNTDNTIDDNEILNNKVGIYSNAPNSIINNNFICYNKELDFNSSDWFSSSGGNNTCDNSHRWNDLGTWSCKYACVVEKEYIYIPLYLG